MQKMLPVIFLLFAAGLSDATDGVADKIPVRENLIVNSSFETGLEGWGYLYPLVNELISSGIDDSCSYDGGRSFLLGNKGITCNPVSSREKGPYVFSFYARSGKADGRVSVSMKGPSESNSKVFVENYKVTSLWQRYVMYIPELPVGSWMITMQSSTGNVWIDALQFEVGATAGSYHPSSDISSGVTMGNGNYGKILYPDEVIEPHINIYNYGQNHGSVTLSYSVKDYYGSTICQKTKSVELPDKKVFTENVQISGLKKKGFYLLSYSLTKNDKVLASGTSSFLIISRPIEGPLEKPYLGICFCPLEVLLKTGLNLQEFYVAWSSIENQKGKMAWANMGTDDHQVKSIDAFINSPYKDKFKLFALICDLWPKWSVIQDGEFRNMPEDEAWKNFIRAIVTRYKGYIRNWEVGAESNAGWPARWGYGQAVKNHEKYVSAAYAAAKEADPDCLLGIMRASGSATGVLTECEDVMKLIKGRFDILSLDPYPTSRIIAAGMSPSKPEGIGDFLRKANALALKYGGKGINVHEIGWMCDRNSLIDGKNFVFQKQYADYIARMALMILAAGSEDINWWIFEDIHRRGNYDYGLWHTGRNCPLPALGAYVNIARLLRGMKSSKKLSAGIVAAYVFELEKGSIAAFWYPDAEHIEKKGEIAISEISGLDISDIMGNAVSGRNVNGKIVLPVSSSPIFIKADLPSDKLSALIENAEMNIGGINIEAGMTDLSTLLVRIFNLEGKTAKGCVRIKAPWSVGLMENEKKYLVPAGKNGTLEFKRKDPLFSSIADAEINISAVTSGGSTISTTANFHIFPCRYMKEKITVDGDLSEWQAVDSISLADREYVYPPDAAWGSGSWQGADDASFSAAYTGWDDKYFYFAAKVRDDVNRENSKPEAGTIPWGGDCIQIAFDASNDASKYEDSGNYSDDDREFILSGITGYSEGIYRSFPYPRMEADGAVLKVKRDKEFTVYELALPWNLVGPQFPHEGMVFGFNFIFADADDTTGVHYSIGLTPGICHGKKPSCFKDFALVREWQLKSKK